uniref:Secreted protein n=1 Tax=Heterorhabditis bacteriophora TaxID=37862 RepID=A0A1I7WJC7_HETBA
MFAIYWLLSVFVFNLVTAEDQELVIPPNSTCFDKSVRNYTFECNPYGDKSRIKPKPKTLRLLLQLENTVVFYTDF